MAKVLIIDDDENIRAMVTAALEAAGHTVQSAHNGEKGLKVLASTLQEVVLLDLMMPGIDGLAVLEQIRDMPGRRRIPVIVITAKHEPGVVAREVELNVVDHLVKPFLPSELEEAITNALDQTGTGSDARRRMLSTDAEIYGSIQSLTDEARASQ